VLRAARVVKGHQTIAVGAAWMEGSLSVGCVLSQLMQNFRSM
jgi:hypothetical protein